MEGEGGLGAVRDIGLAQSFVGSEGAADAAQHHIQFGILEFEAEQFQPGGQLIFGDAEGRLLSAAALLCIAERSGGKDGEELKPGASVHKPT